MAQLSSYHLLQKIMGTLNASNGVALQIMSDLHLETLRLLSMYTEFKIQPQAKHLALLGDIGNISDPRFFTFLEEVLEQYEVVFFVLGNHEPYSDEARDTPMSFRDAVAVMGEFEQLMENMRENGVVGNIGRFVVLNRRRWDLDETTTVLGCTLFSKVTEEQESTVSLFVSDFSNIKDWTVRDHNETHATDLSWLNEQISQISREEPNRRVIVLTHHSPTIQPEANNPDHLEDPKGIISAFSTDLPREICWTDSAVKVWAFGHTHWNCDFVDEKTGKRVVANQRGYGREDIFDFDPDKVILLD